MERNAIQRGEPNLQTPEQSFVDRNGKQVPAQEQRRARHRCHDQHVIERNSQFHQQDQDQHEHRPSVVPDVTETNQSVRSARHQQYKPANQRHERPRVVVPGRLEPQTAPVKDECDADQIERISVHQHLTQRTGCVYRAFRNGMTHHNLRIERPGPTMQTNSALRPQSESGRVGRPPP